MTDTAQPIRRALPHIARSHSMIAEWMSGHVFTPQGIVTVFARRAHVELSFVHGSRLHRRSFDDRLNLTEKQLTILAGRFAREKAASS